MKLKLTSVLAIAAIISFSTGCQKETNSITSANELSAIAEVSGTGGAYTNIFEGKKDNGNGTYTYTWSMQNNTGSQNLSHWTMDLGTCVTIDDVVSASQGADLNNMTSVEVLWKVDPSLSNENLTGCNITVPVFKFGQGRF